MLKIVLPISHYVLFIVLFFSFTVNNFEKYSQSASKVYIWTTFFISSIKKVAKIFLPFSYDNLYHANLFV